MTFISEKERKLLLTLAFLCFLFSIFNFSGCLINKYNSYVSEKQSDMEAQANDDVHFAIYSFERPPLNPLFSFVNIFLLSFAFINLYKSKRFLLSSFFTSISFYFFIYLIIDTRRLIGAEEEDSTLPLTNLDRIIYKASYLEFACYLTVSILLFWQISILLRMLIRNSQRKNVLP